MDRVYKPNIGELFVALNTPHGGALVNLIADESQLESLKKETLNLPSWDLTERQVCDLELLMNGAFSPLTGFMNQKDYASVLSNMRLADGSLWSMPITLDVPKNVADELAIGDKLALRDIEGVVLAVITVE